MGRWLGLALQQGAGGTAASRVSAPLRRAGPALPSGGSRRPARLGPARAVPGCRRGCCKQDRESPPELPGDQGVSVQGCSLRVGGSEHDFGRETDSKGGDTRLRETPQQSPPSATRGAEGRTVCIAISVSVFSAPPVQLGLASALLGKGLTGTPLGTCAGLTPCDSEVLSRFWVFLGSWPLRGPRGPGPLPSVHTEHGPASYRGWDSLARSREAGQTFVLSRTGTRFSRLYPGTVQPRLSLSSCPAVPLRLPQGLRSVLPGCRRTVPRCSPSPRMGTRGSLVTLGVAAAELRLRRSWLRPALQPSQLASS